MHAGDDPYQAPAAALHEDIAPVALVDAGRWRRLSGSIIDGIIESVLLVGTVLGVGAMFDWGWQDALRWSATSGWVGEVAGTGLALLAFLLVQGPPLVLSGQTWAKKLLDMRIVDLDGRAPDAARLLGMRFLLPRVIGQVPILGPLFALFDALNIFSHDRRCFHDRMAGTRVVRVRGDAVAGAAQDESGALWQRYADDSGATEVADADDPTRISGPDDPRAP